MANSLPLTQRTPPQGSMDSDISTIQLTPIFNFRNSGKDNSENDVLDTFLAPRNSKSCIGPKKRRHSGVYSEMEILALKERMETLEKTVEDLTTFIKEKDGLIRKK